MKRNNPNPTTDTTQPPKPPRRPRPKRRTPAQELACSIAQALIAMHATLLDLSQCDSPSIRTDLISRLADGLDAIATELLPAMPDQ